MWIKITKNGAGQGYYHLVESYRDNGRVRQRTLLSLGKVGEDRLDNLISAISRHKEVMSILDVAKSMSIRDTYIYGPLIILEKLFGELGINVALSKVEAKHPKLNFDLKQIIFTLVACRFIRPGSKLKVFEHLQEKLYPEMICKKWQLHQLYRCLDILSEHKEEIESKLYWHDRDLLNMEVDVVMYDLTTLRFESTREDKGELRRFGYSKEKRSDCTQVVLGLLVDPEGIPLGFEVYPGNTFEGKTLEHIVKKMRKKFKVRRFIFVADRGLFSAKNLEHIRGSEKEPNNDAGEFIVGMKLGVFTQRHEAFYDRSKFRRLNENLSIYETTHGEDRCIVTWSRIRAERDRKTREDILTKIKKKLSLKKVSSKTFVSNQNYQKYVSGLSDGKNPILNEAAIEKEAKKDGFFGVITNVRDMPAQEIIFQYKKLWVVEDAFGELKGSLKARPVFHWTDHRIVGHLTMCFLAYYCEAHMTKMLRDKKIMLKSRAIEQKTIEPRALTVVEAMRELSEVRAIPVKIRSKKVWVRTDITGNAAKLFKSIGIKIPPKVLNLDVQT
jgi:transposase